MESIELTDFQRSYCKRLIKKMCEEDVAQSFIKPLDSSQLPDYDQIITRKMCFEDVLHNLDNRIINTLEDFKNDTLLIFANCIKYWTRKEDGYVVLAQTLKESFLKLYQKIPSSSEEEWLLKVQKTAKKLQEARTKFSDELMKKLSETGKR